MRKSVFLPALLLAACGPKSTWTPPVADGSAGWGQLPPSATSGVAVPGASWWQAFGDPELDALVGRVLAANGDLAAAGIRLRQAELSTRLAARALLPAASASLSSGASKSFDGDRESRSSSASLGVAWEADLFGKLAAQRDVLKWEQVATAEDLAATRLGLIGTTIIAWYQLAHANERIAIADDSLAYTRKALGLVSIQYRAGQVSKVELRDAEQSVASQEAARTQLVQARTEARNALAALMAQQAYDGPERRQLPRTALPAVDLDRPTDLLSRRPDLAAAEYRLRSLLSNVDATRASFYPTLSLSAAVDTLSGSLGGFFGDPGASFGGILSLPFLNPERVRLSVGIARAQYAAAAESFRQIFHNSVRDVSDALSARAQYAAQAEALQRSYAAAEEAEHLYERQYRAGAIPLRQWLDAQERRRSALAALADNRLNRLVNQVTLEQALGGDRPGASPEG